MKNIALLTDFGTKDYFVGAMKGVILSINENAHIIDITHEIPNQDISAAGFNLNACYKNFPKKTIFVAVVDPGVGSERRAILVGTKDYYFIAPDNGLLSFAFQSEKEVKVYELTNEEFFHKPISRTFHGRDIFSPVAAHLSKGIKPMEFGREIKDYKNFKIKRPKKNENGEIQAEIIHIDHFGNIILNISKSDLPKTFTVKLGNHQISNLRKYFADGVNSKNEAFMIFGSAELLEIVINQQSAANILSAKVGDKVIISP